jgi:hypothetical protein
MPKITELPTYETVEVSGDDVFPIVDTITDTTKKATVSQISDFVKSQHTNVVTQATSDTSTLIATDAFVHNVVAQNNVNNSVGMAKAWVNFNGAQTFSGLITLHTYVQSGTTITVVMSGTHGMEVGNICNLDFTSGLALDRPDFVVASVIDANTFTVIANNSVTTSGYVVRNNYIRSSYNVSSIVDMGVGYYTINFTTPMHDTNYSCCASGNRVDGTYIGVTIAPVALSVNSVTIYCTVVDNTARDSINTSVVIFGN